jgi:hypothetical protein
MYIITGNNDIHHHKKSQVPLMIQASPPTLSSGLGADGQQESRVEFYFTILLPRTVLVPHTRSINKAH